MSIYVHPIRIWSLFIAISPFSICHYFHPSYSTPFIVPPFPFLLQERKKFTLFNWKREERKRERTLPFLTDREKKEREREKPGQTTSSDSVLPLNNKKEKKKNRATQKRFTLPVLILSLSFNPLGPDPLARGSRPSAGQTGRQNIGGAMGREGLCLACRLGSSLALQLGAAWQKKAGEGGRKEIRI